MILTLGSFLTGLLTVCFVIFSLFLVLAILIQKPKGGGLAGAFGGGGGSASAMFGAKTGDMLTWITVGFFALFILLAMGLVWSTRWDSDALKIVTPTIQAPATSGSMPPIPASEIPVPSGATVPATAPAASTSAPAPAPVTPTPTPAPAPDKK